MNDFERVFSHDAFRDRPPVLVDLGASGGIDPRWKPIAKYATCVAFDGDAREMGGVHGDGSGFGRLHVVPKVVVASDAPRALLHLTKSPFCSSTLRPTPERLAGWPFAGLFEVERTVEADAVTLPQVLRELGIGKVDWFKADTQGIDLRLFRSLGDDATRRVLAVELEPGIIDAYEGEDLLTHVLAHMRTGPFWLAELTPRGVQRIRRSTLDSALGRTEAELFQKLGRTSPGWAELLYLNTFEDPATLDLRDHLLGWVFLVLAGQHGAALDLALVGKERFAGEAIFEALVRSARARIRRALAGEAWRVPAKVVTKGARSVRRLLGG